MRNILIGRLLLLHKVKAFTMLEGLLTFSLVTFLTLSLSAGAKRSLEQTRETLFLLSFETLYKDSQQVAIATRQEVPLSFSTDHIRSSFQELAIPEGVTVKGPEKILFAPDGGNSSLAKVSFDLGDKQVDYQLYLGSGRYKKTSR